MKEVFGSVRTNSDRKEYSVRDVAEDHVYEDLGFIPTIEQWFADMPIHDWMGGSERGKQKVEIKNSEPFRISEEDMKKILDKIDQKSSNWPFTRPDPYKIPLRVEPYKPYDRPIVTD